MFTIYDNITAKTNALPKDSPAFTSRYFKILPADPSSALKTLGQPVGATMDTIGFFGIAEEPPQIKYTTEWGPGPASTFVEKYEEFMSHKMVKTFGAANHDYRPIVGTDSWTQQIPQKGTVIEVPIKFRSYPMVAYKTMNFYRAIWQLYFYTAPKPFQFSDGLNIISEAMDKAAKVGFDFGNAISKLNDSIKTLQQNQAISSEQKWNDIINIATRDNFYTNIDDIMQKTAAEIAGDMSNEATRAKLTAIRSIEVMKFVLNKLTAPDGSGCETFTLQYGNLFKSSYNDWIISNWSFKPAVQTTNYAGRIVPIYIDISLTLRTAGQVGTGDLSRLFNYEATSLDVLEEEEIID